MNQLISIIIAFLSIFQMPFGINMGSRQKSPYTMLLNSSKTKLPSEMTRRIYMNQLPLKRLANAKSVQEETHRRYYASTRSVMRDLKLNFARSPEHNLSFEPISDRKAKEHKKSRLLQKKENFVHSKSSKNKLCASSSRFDKAQKSTLISSLLASQHQHQLKLIQDRKIHQLGKNCRVVVIDGNEETQHFIEVAQMGDILTTLKKEYPRICYYRAVPVQITLDYLLTQQKVEGQFLNGQTLYLKPATKEYSFNEESSLRLCDFQILKLIGSGGFSRVFLCRFRRDGKFYAMKVIEKEVIVKNKKKNIIMNERNIMQTATHPFLIDMRFAFETEKCLIFVIEYCPGGELFGLIKKYRRISEDVSRFYIIQIFLGLSYLHQSHVVYRDIKPENILLGQDGHVKIADLGLAKPDMFEGELAYSFCGSPQYMSPEMILQVGHTYPVDFYCMGALLYELLTGLPPFYSRDTNQIYEAVISEQLNFPDDVPLTPECKSLLRGLLCKDSKLRLGSIHGVKQILAHPWFGKNSYKNFLEKKIAPPITFDTVGRIDLDKQGDEKGQKQVEEMIRLQHSEANRFKKQMKKFYFDYRGLTEERKQGSNVQKENKEKLLLRSSSNRKGITNLDRSVNASESLLRKCSQKQLNKTQTLNSSRK